MNQRIKEIELDAAYGTIDPNGSFTPEEFNNFVQKFAELLINECADLFEGVYTDTCPGKRIDTSIKKHFGLE